MQHPHYLISLITAVIELVFFTGLIFGWSSISYVLKKENYFDYLCKSATQDTGNSSGFGESAQTQNSLLTTTESTTSAPNCDPQDESLNLVFTIASFILSIFTLPNGFIFDHYGTWVSRVIAILLVTSGAVLLSFSSVETSLLLFPAMCGFSIGGILLLVTNMQLGNLYPHFKSSIITLMNGSLDSSSVVFLLVKLAYDSGYSFNSIFQFMAVCTVFLWLRTIFVMPQKHVPSPLPKQGFKYGIYDCMNLRQQVAVVEADQELNESEKESLEKLDSDAVVVENESVIGFWDCIKTSKFWMNTFHFSVLQLRNYFFFSSFITWLGDLLDDKSHFDTYVNAFGICQFFGIVCAPLNGFLIDGVKYFHRSAKDQNLSSVNLFAIAVSSLVTSSWGLLFSLCVLLPVPQLQYLSFVLQVAFRSFLYGGNASFIALVFPIQHFGKIYGMTMTLAGIVSLLQFPLYSLVLRYFDGNFMVMNIIFLVACCLTYIHPVFLYRNSKKSTKIEENNSEAEKTLVNAMSQEKKDIDA